MTSLTTLDLSGWNFVAVAFSSNIFSSTNAGLTVTCNDQDLTPDGTGSAGTGTIFSKSCN